jgi:acyl dehydratase/NAD(P)-dependent dehydrogenase (short-subunit alcohol dehydrogenase family)
VSKPSSPDPIERELRFTHEDMALFAAASGDRSPLHMDPAFARRTSFGERIVHGGLLSIGMLGLLPAEVLANVRSVRSSFPGPVLPGESLRARAQGRSDRPGEWEVRLTGRGRVLARVLASGSDDLPAALEEAAMLERAAAQGEEIAPEEIVGEYRVGPELGELTRRFGVQSLSSAVLDGIAWASNVVGMTIPGFDGLCAAVTIVAAGSDPGAAEEMRQWVRLRDRDERTDRLLVEGVLADEKNVPRCLGLIECFPFSPTPLPDSAALTSEGPLEPSQGKVVIVGGSRGFGAALALALLARAYVVHVVYSSSSDGAEELTRLAGPYAARLFLHRTDAGDTVSVSQVAAAIGSSIEGLALCAAPPPLGMTLTGDSAGELARYVAGSVALTAVPLAHFLPLLARGGGWVLICSASAVTEPASDLPQFTAAKAALEGLARWLAVIEPAARIVVLRAPKMRTDLTNTPSARRAAAPPQAVAASILKRLAGDGLPAGLSIIELDQAEVGA